MDGELHLVALADLQCPPDLVKAGYVAKEKDGRSRHLKTGRGEPLTEVQLTLPGILRPKFPPSRLADAFDQVVRPLIAEVT